MIANALLCESSLYRVSNRRERCFAGSGTYCCLHTGLELEFEATNDYILYCRYKLHAS
jgi:hypothetical protein